jgi:hypothetical protein
MVTLLISGTIKEIYTFGSNYVPEFAVYSLMINSVEKICFSLIYPQNSKMNEKYAENMLIDLTNIVEEISKFENVTASDYIKTD